LFEEEMDGSEGGEEELFRWNLARLLATLT
jgi:hypothetical protein